MSSTHLGFTGHLRRQLRNDNAAYGSCNGVGVHPLLATRWSPTSFDVEHVVSAADVTLLLEAARWAPSAGNSQPWSFIVGVRDDQTHRRIVPHLAKSAAQWAPSASLLVVNLAHRLVEETDWEYSEFSLYDLGQAVAHMTVQAQALGLLARQFRAFDRDGLAEEFTVPSHWQVTTVSAFGVAAANGSREGGAGPGRRQRRTVTELVWPGQASNGPKE